METEPGLLSEGVVACGDASAGLADGGDNFETKTGLPKGGRLRVYLCVDVLKTSVSLTLLT